MLSNNPTRIVSSGRCEKCRFQKTDYFSRVNGKLWCMECCNELSAQTESVPSEQVVDAIGGPRGDAAEFQNYMRSNFMTTELQSSTAFNPSFRSDHDPVYHQEWTWVHSDPVTMSNSPLDPTPFDPPHLNSYPLVDNSLLPSGNLELDQRPPQSYDEFLHVQMTEHRPEIGKLDEPAQLTNSFLEGPYTNDRNEGQPRPTEKESLESDEEPPKLSPPEVLLEFSKRPCFHCGQDRLGRGRCHPVTGRPICTACADYYHRTGVDRPTDVIKRQHRRNRVFTSGRMCYNCKSTTTRRDWLLNRHTCSRCQWYYQRTGRHRPTKVCEPG